MTQLRHKTLRRTTQHKQAKYPFGYGACLTHRSPLSAIVSKPKLDKFQLQMFEVTVTRFHAATGTPTCWIESPAR